MPNPVRPKRRRWPIFLGLLILLLAGLGVAFSRRGDSSILVETQRVERRNLTETVVANGRVHPVVQVKISPEVSGEIIELPVREGQPVKKGDLLLRIKPDFYQASKRSAEASFQAAVAGRELAEATYKKTQVEEQRNRDLLAKTLVSASVYLEHQTACEVARASLQSAAHQVDVARAALSRADEELAKTTIYSPLTGTVTKLNSQSGERVVGTAMMTGTEVMVISDLNEMEARVDIGEVDVVLMAPGQRARLEVDAFRDRKFNGTVTEIANSSRNLAQLTQGGGGGNQQQEATRFEVRIRITEKENFRPGMSVTAEIETRSRSNVLSVPIQSVTTRAPKNGGTNQLAPKGSNALSSATNGVGSTNSINAARKPGDGPKPVEVVFLADGEQARLKPVQRGISDDNYTEILDGLTEGQEVVSGGFKAISRELEDGKTIRRGTAGAEKK